MRCFFLASIAILSLIKISGQAQALSSPCDFSCPFQGFYIGAAVGWAAHDKTFVDRDNWAADFGAPFSLSSIATLNSGVIGGPEVGYNWRCCRTVFGVEADFNWSQLASKKLYLPVSSTSEVAIFRDRCCGFGTLRGRAGITADNILLYGTFGAAFADFRHEWAITSLNSDGVFVTEGFHVNRTRWGLAFGAGAEWALSKSVSIKGEALYLKFQELRHTSFSNTAGQLVTFDIQDALWVVRAGINFNLCNCFCLFSR